MSRVLVTGGCGYVGSVLVPKLIAAGHDVEIVDLCWFGVRLDAPLHRMDFTEVPLDGFDAIIHLAGISNDPMGELNPKLAWETNALGTTILAHRASEAGVAQFIYASSGSVYGVSDAPEVTECTPLAPISDYNKTKMVAERALWSYGSMNVQIVRPATVCGWSPRMRLDVMVNSFVIQALTKGVITYNGGDQYRPNIHIDDMTDLYVWLLSQRSWGVLNAGFENLRINEIAMMVADIVGAKIAPSQSMVDPRSYRMNSDRLLSYGFKPKKKVADAINELVQKYRDGQLKDFDECYNIRTMQRLKAA